MLSLSAYLWRHCCHTGTRSERLPKVLDVSLPTCRALCRPRQTLGALTKACAPCWLLRPLAHRHLLYSLNEAVSRLRGVRPPLRPTGYSVYASTLLFGHCAQHLCPWQQARRGAARSPPDAEVFPTAVTPQTGLSSSVSAATLDRGGWLALAPQGLAPVRNAKLLGAQRKGSAAGRLPRNSHNGQRGPSAGTNVRPRPSTRPAKRDPPPMKTNSPRPAHTAFAQQASVAATDSPRSRPAPRAAEPAFPTP